MFDPHFDEFRRQLEDVVTEALERPSNVPLLLQTPYGWSYSDTTIAPILKAKGIAFEEIDDVKDLPDAPLAVMSMASTALSNQIEDVKRAVRGGRTGRLILVTHALPSFYNNQRFYRWCSYGCVENTPENVWAMMLNAAEQFPAPALAKELADLLMEEWERRDTSYYTFTEFQRLYQKARQTPEYDDWQDFVLKDVPFRKVTDEDLKAIAESHRMKAPGTKIPPVRFRPASNHPRQRAAH